MNPNIKSISAKPFSSAVSTYIVSDDNEASTVPASLINNADNSVYGSIGYCIKKIVERHRYIYQQCAFTFYYTNLNSDNLNMRED